MKIEKDYYTEKIKLPAFILVIYWVVFLFFIGYSWKKDDYSLTTTIIVAVVGLLLHFQVFKLKITNSYIEYSMFPFVRKKIDRSTIKSYEIINISALGDFGGWGIRYSGKYGWGYIMNGGYAVFLKYGSNKKVTFSIKDKDKIKLYLSGNNK